jgi:hypothetical protein
MARSTKGQSAAFTRLTTVFLDRHPDVAAKHLENARIDEAAALLASESTNRAREVLRRRPLKHFTKLKIRTISWHNSMRGQRASFGNSWHTRRIAPAMSWIPV